MYADEQDIGSTFWPLWQQYQDYLYDCCVKWTGNVADAEDALSRAMLKAWDKISNSTIEIKNFKAWLSQLTYNLCVDMHREHHRGGRQVESLDTIGFEEQEIASQQETPVLVVTQQELENFFCLAIDELPIRLRETFILHFQEELSYKEIGEKLNISYDNVRKRISQARTILKQRYHQDFVGEEDRYSSDLDECKSQAFFQSRKRQKSRKIVQAEAMNDQTLALSDQLQTGQIVEQETTVQAVTVSQIVVVDVPSDREVEEVGKTPDVKEDYLVREVEDIRNCGDLQQVVPFHHAQISWRKGLINEKIKKLALGFNMINLRRLVLVSGIALSAITFTPKAQAQTTQDVNFNGNISPAFTFSFGSGANPTPTTGFSGNSFQGTVNVSISCSTGAFISVSVPERIAAPLGFNDAFRKARVRLGNSFTSAEVGSSTGFPLWTNSAPAPLSIGGCTSEPLVVEMITGSTDVGSSPAGSYTYRVTLTATAQ